MRVLQLIDSLEAGGAERMAVNLANALVVSIERSYLCATRAEGLLKQSLNAEVGYLFLKRRHTLDFLALQRLVRFITQERITVIHAHASSFFMASLLTLRVPKLRLIWHDHYGNSEYLDQRPKRVLQWCSKRFAGIIAVNAHLETWNRKALYCKTVVFLPNFVVKSSTITAVTELEGVLGKRLLCLANLRPQKDHITLLEACKVVFEIYPDWSLHCVGQEGDGDYIQTIKTSVHALGIAQQVWFYGSCPDTEHIISQADIGVLASTSEGLPLALLEYGQGRLAVVATAVGDCERVIPTKAYGILVPPNNVQALAAAIIAYIDDATARAKAATALHTYIGEHYAQEAIIIQLLTLYKS
ncbi:glycosyltransferase [Formosa sediminum]|uniref:Glycosyltransferase n=1 Tax=Formosa sediminum TaxID=2594004 RepID=A0A516GRP3_9FLAO|nr:glycosyltransferase [Formosa sediminum]QDO94188.1 glycosyltransferase [Formosa sediminum]